jgi:hypothetical protein
LTAVDSSLTPDNVDFPKGMDFLQRRIADKNELRILVEYGKVEESRNLETLISTLDEILAHIYSATRTIEEAERS